MSNVHPMPQKESAVSLRNVAAYYWRSGGYLRPERYWALKDVSLDLHRGESLGIIGRNGAGKSTLLKLLAGITRPDKGTIYNPGYRATLLSLQAGFIPNLTGRDNAILSGMLLGMKKKDIKSRLPAIQEFAGLNEFFYQPVNTYSTGMKGRLGFAVASQLEPDIFLIDEVLGVGDAEFKRKSERMMKNLIRSDRTVVIVSHSPSSIKELCDRAVWIEGGRTRAEGPAGTVLDAYSNEMTKGRSDK